MGKGWTVADGFRETVVVVVFLTSYYISFLRTIGLERSRKDVSSVRQPSTG